MMTDEQIEKLANYITFLRRRFDAYWNDGNKEMAYYVGGKLEAARETTVIFDCREEVFKKVEEMEAKK